MVVKVEMNRLEALLADYPLTSEQARNIRRKVNRAGFGFDDPFALEIAMREISRYDSATDRKKLRQAASEVHKSVRDAGRFSSIPPSSRNRARVRPPNGTRPVKIRNQSAPKL